MRRCDRKHGWSYSGVAWTDRDGHAVVSLPRFAHLHEAGFECELEAVDSESRVLLEHEVEDGRFAIVSDEPHTKVAWRVTAYRAELKAPVQRPYPDRKE